MRIRTQFAAIAAVAMLGTLAACGGGDDKAADAPAPAADTGSTPADSGAASGATITMMDNSFTPAALTVAPGTTISIVNKGNARHDLIDKKTIDSGDINGGGMGSVVAPTAPGDYKYKCKYHFGMEGTLTVK